MPKQRRFMVAKRVTKDLDIEVGGQKRKFWSERGGKADFFYESDPAKAAEIDAKYGKGGTGDVWVKEHDRAEWWANTKDGSHLHTYTFGSTKSFRDGWEKIFGKKEHMTV